jgi:predicted aminopeptidase
VPYKGFFDRELAQAEARALATRGLDTSIRTAAAFSTLGWFNDPLLRHQLTGDDVSLVNLVMHEVYHSTFYTHGAHATAFNESLATFVGYRAAIDFFAARPGDAAALQEAREAWEDERTFGRFVQDIAARLRVLYASNDEPSALAARQGVFAAAADEFKRLRFHGQRFEKFVFAAAADEFKRLRFHGQRFEKFDDVPLNNAVLLQSLLYTTDLEVLEAIAARLGGLRPALDVIEAAARAEPKDPFAAVERALAKLNAPE